MKEIIDSINNDTGFIKENNFKLVSLTKEKAVIECEIKKSGLNPMGICHGGLLFGLADTAAGTLAFTKGKSVTTSGNINYLKPAKNKIIATATILKVGNHIGYYLVEIKDENNDLVATANINMFFVD